MNREEQIQKAANKCYPLSDNKFYVERVDYQNEAFIEGAEWADKNPFSPWISVEESAPTNDNNVFYKNYLSGAVGVANYYSDTKEWFSAYSIEKIIGVTHWMEIPE